MRISLFILLTVILGCSSLSDEELWKRIELAKARQNWDSTRQVAQRILTEYPSGRYSSWAQFALAESFRFQNRPREALDNYKIFIERYPEMQPSALSLFLVGYIYGNNLHMYDSAKYHYEHFLQKYPDHELAPSVKMELETMGKSPQQVLESATERDRSLTKK